MARIQPVASTSYATSLGTTNQSTLTSGFAQSGGVQEKTHGGTNTSSTSLSSGTPQRSRRLFLGPMPHGKVVEDNARADIGSELDDEEFHKLLDEFVERHGLYAFLRLGGKVEDWGEAAAKRVREKMRTKWEGSEWVKAVRKKSARDKRKATAGTGAGHGMEWVGSSFDVAEVFGVDLLHAEDDDETLQDYKPNGVANPDDGDSTLDVLSGDASVGPASRRGLSPSAFESFVTARSTFSDLQENTSSDRQPVTTQSATSGLDKDDTLVLPSQTQLTLETLAEFTPRSTRKSRNSSPDSQKHSATSSTPLLPYEVTRDTLVVPTSQAGLKSMKSDGDINRASTSSKSILSGPSKANVKRKSVHYDETSTVQKASVPDSAKIQVEESGSLRKPVGDQPSTTAENVLSRPDGETGTTSASASAATSASKDGIKARDRMLVRVFHCSHSGISKTFDEKECSVTRGLLHRDWAEFMVIWHKDRIELYEDYILPGQERVLGHKHIAGYDLLSDLSSYPRQGEPILCGKTDITSILGRTQYIRFQSKVSQSSHRLVLENLVKQNQNVGMILSADFDATPVFHRTALGGKLPATLQVHCPMFRGSVTFEIPPTEDGYKNFSREQVLANFERSLAVLPDWNDLRQRPEMQDRKLMLCWRTETKIDWLWLDGDVDGNKREWEVVYGLMMASAKYPAKLEVRLAQHYATHLTQRNGQRLDEPPSIEGYLHRIRRNSQGKAALVYLATYDGQLFTVRMSDAEPPASPTTLIALGGKDGHNSATFRRRERERATRLVQKATFYCDIRDIVAVRRAFQVIVRTEGEGYESNLSRERSVGNEESVAGEEHGAKANGDAIQVPGMYQEVNARIVWPTVPVVDSDNEDEGGDEGLAKIEDKGKVRMRRSFELVYKTGYVMRFEAHSCKVAIDWVNRLRDLVAYWKLRHRADARLEMDLLQACTGRGGVTIVKRVCDLPHGHTPPSVPDAEDASPYLDAFWNICTVKPCRPVIKSGRLFTKRKFRGQYAHTQLVLVQGHLLLFGLTRSPQMNYHQALTISLLDAYICSGYFVAMALPLDEYNPNSPPVARLFQDGLESMDAEEDTLFMIWYRPHNVKKGEPIEKLEEAFIPGLSARHRILMCRARSGLERDAWCWALNCEVERLARATRVREKKAREQGAPRT